MYRIQKIQAQHFSFKKSFKNYGKTKANFQIPSQTVLTVQEKNDYKYFGISL